MEREILTVKILSREYQISCPKGTELDLQEAASYLNEKINEIKNNAKNSNFEAILITAAINISYQTIKQKLEVQNLIQNLNLLEKKLTNVLQKSLSSNKLELEYNENSKD